MRIIDKKTLRGKVPYSPPQIDRMEAAGDFPKRVKLGPNRVGWIEDEVDVWIKARVDERDAAPVEI